jgi:CubicO group peptidase (beta-lactamase class C family)
MNLLAVALLSFPASPPDLPQGLDELLAPWVAEDAPGGAVAVLRPGEEPLLRVFGLANLEPARPVTADTLFYLASTAKPFTAACVVRAAREGELDLDASVRELFPELPETCAPATLRHCLQHRSGIPDVYDAAIALDLGPEAVSSNAAAIERIARLPAPAFEPGSRFLYSNSGYVLAAEALRRATGRDLAAHARAHLFEPLGIEGAGWVGDGDVDPAPASYRRGADGWVQQEVKTGLRGPGGLCMSAAALVRWEQGWRDGTWGDDGLREELLRPPEPPHHPTLGAYAAGWMLLRLGGQRAQRHFGGAFGHSADLLRFPDHGLSVIVLSNRADLDASDLGELVARLALGDAWTEPTGPAPVALQPDERAAFGRFWEEPGGGRPWVLLARDGGFRLATLGDVRVQLVPVSPTRLEAIGAQGPFALELEGERLWIRHPGVEGLALGPVSPSRPAPGLTSELAGAWTCPELGAEVVFEDLGGRLALTQTRPLLELSPFQPVGGDLLLCDEGAALRVHRDADGRPVGLRVDTNRARGLRLVRAR